MTVQMNTTSPSFSGNVVVKASKKVPRQIIKLINENQSFESVANDGFDLKIKVLSKNALKSGDNHNLGDELFKIKVSAVPENNGNGKISEFFKNLFKKNSYSLTRRYHSAKTNMEALYNLGYWKLKVGLKLIK